MFTKRIGFIVFLLLTLGLAACSGPQDTREADIIAVKKVMEKRAKALQSQDLQLFSALIYDAYDDGRSTKASIVAETEAAFKRYKHIKLNYQRSPVEFNMNTARLIQRISYQLDEQPLIHEREILILRKINGEWLISAGVIAGLF
ncbi:MAG: hypothetical protein OEZ58_11595 [Gammaproteobacteria bacterium]|nr:hypothetical protein [Gammaproteobacteria bacterium]MDH5729628.1 hypothetical protein [Gammaproteobacteria bacterium]